MKNFESFLTEKGITKEQMEKKSAEEVAKLYNEYNEKTLTDIKELSEKSATENAKAIQELKDQLSNDRAEQVKQLNAKLDEMGVTIKKLTQAEKDAKASTQSDVRKALTEQLEGIKALKDKKNAESIIFKVAGNMTSANITGGNVPVEQRLPGLDIVPSRRTTLLDLVARGTADSNVISWVSQANKDGSAGQTAEGTAKNQIDFDLVVNSESLKKTTAYIKVSTEMLDDISFIESEINNELMREVMKAVESQVYSGDGTGLNLNGITTQASAFSAGSHALTVDNANEADVLVVANEQIELAEHDGASAIFMNPADVNKLLLIKASTTDRRYIDRLVMVAGQMSLDGIPIVKSTLVTAGTYLIGDFSKCTWYNKGDVSIEMGLDADDFTKNMRTIIAEVRSLNLIKTNDTTAFVAGTFATDKTALETT